MSRTFTLWGYSSILLTHFYAPVELDINSSYGIGLLGFHSYNSLFNVDESNNKIVLHFEDESVPFSLFIPLDTYKIDEINKVIQEEIKQNIYDTDKEMRYLPCR